MEKEEIIFLTIIIILTFGVQFYIADRILFGDDYIFAAYAKNNKFLFTENAHPPLPVWSDILLTELFPLTNRTMRLTSIFFTTATIWLVYYTVKRIYSKKTAIIAALLTGFSAWHIRASQMNSGSDGGMFTFFFYCTIYLFIRFLETKQIKYTIAAGIAFGLTMLSKEAGILLVPICGIYYLYTLWKTEKYQRKEELKMAVKHSIGMVVIAGIVWSIFPILDIIYNNGQSTSAIIERMDAAVSEKETAYSYWFMMLFSIFKILIWIGPLLLFLSILFIITKKEWSQASIFIILLIVGVVFYIIITPPNLDRTRYLMITIPALAILSARYIEQNTAEWRKKEWFFVTTLSLVMFIGFFFINQNTVIVSYESQQNLIVLLKQGNLNFSIPVFTETDNSGFLLHFVIFMITYTATFFLIIILIMINKKDDKERWKRIGKIALIIFLSISIGYNFIVAEAYGLHWTSPNYSDGIKEIIMYAEENDLQEPLYLLKNYELQYYLGEKYTYFVSAYGISEINEEKILEFKQQLKQEGGTIIFTDMPPIDKEGLLWQMINGNCVAEYVVDDKGIEIGWVFAC